MLCAPIFLVALFACTAYAGYPAGVVNVALGKPAELSSRSLLFGNPGKVVDGNKATSMFHCGETSNIDFGRNRYWRVDLQGYFKVFGVRITNRGDWWYKRQSDFDILVTNSAAYTGESDDKTSNLCAHKTGPMGQGATEEFVCQKPIVGHYVTVIMHTNKHTLALCEVEVMGMPANATGGNGNGNGNGGVNGGNGNGNSSGNGGNGNGGGNGGNGNGNGGGNGNGVDAGAWANSKCADDSSCGEGNSMCFKGKCMCAPGYFFSVGSGTCVESCKSLNETYNVYNGARINGEDYRKETSLSAKDCMKKCNDEKQCLAVSATEGKKAKCYFHKVTALKVNNSFRPNADGWTYLQKNCD